MTYCSGGWSRLASQPSGTTGGGAAGPEFTFGWEKPTAAAPILEPGNIQGGSQHAASGNSTLIGIIVGAVGGCCLCLLLAGVLAFLLNRRKREKKKDHIELPESTIYANVSPVSNSFAILFHCCRSIRSLFKRGCRQFTFEVGS
jgi:hypothetical protein